MLSLEGKVAIVTGGRRGIGRAIADGLAAEGARIAILDVVGAEEAARAYEGGLGLRGDVSSEADTVRLVEAVASHFGRIDILVNNAAIFATLKMMPFTEIALDDWKRVLDVNVGGVFLMCRAVVPHLRQQGKGNHRSHWRAGSIWRPSRWRGAAVVVCLWHRCGDVAVAIELLSGRVRTN